MSRTRTAETWYNMRPMNFLPADYVILGVAAVAAFFGLVGGFSGALAFLAGTVGGAAAGRLAWSASLAWFDAAWARALASLALALVAFGLVRKIVRLVVHNILAQPGDAIFGFLVAAVSGFALALTAAHLLVLSDLWPVKSVLLDQAYALLGAS